MPSQASIDVRVIVNGRPVREYYDGAIDLDDEFLRTRYIEMKAGQEFGIRVKLLQGFEFKSAKFVEAVVKIDNHGAHRPCKAKAADMQLSRVGGGRLLTDFVVADDWNGQTKWNEGCGEWTRMKWAFGALGYSKLLFKLLIEGLLTCTDDKDAATCEMTPNEVSKIGCLQITVYRAERERHTKASDGEMSRDPVEVPDELPETVMKGLAIKNNTK